jgi:two-component system, NtrC family, response regulator HydG
METMVVLDFDGQLDVDDLPPELADVQESSGPIATAGGPTELIGRTMDDIERWAIEETLKLTNGNREEAAKILAIGARTLYRKLEKYQSGEGATADDE